MQKNNDGYVDDYTDVELMAIVASREIKNGDNVFCGIGMPLLAAFSAVNTHAPEATIALEGGYVGGKPPGALWAVGDSGAGYRCTAAQTMWRIFSDIQRGFYNKSLLASAQIDKYGNLNTTVITTEDTDYYTPKLRLPGSGGGNDVATNIPETIIMMKMEKRRFVRELDYLTSPGYFGGGTDREELGMRGGPNIVITDKCVLRFDDKTKEMYLDQVHPGSTIEEVKNSVQWDLKIADEVGETERPTEKEVEFFRAMDPTDITLRIDRLYEDMDFFEWADKVEGGWDKMMREKKI